MEDIPDDVEADGTTVYVLRLTNGDIISGTIKEIVDYEKEGPGIRMKTEIGTALIFASQIEEIVTFRKNYRQRHRIYLLPTAMPISDDHFIGIYELFFLYAGFGITDYVSITAGRTILPFLESRRQVTNLNIKISALQTDFKPYLNNFSLAFGYNLGLAQHNNRMTHIYGVATAEFERTMLTAAMFYKTGSKNFYIVRAGINERGFFYSDGSMGIGFGIDTRLPKWKSMRFIGEIWNTDVNNPTNSAVLLGIRIGNTDVSTDFGISFFTEPFVAPFVSFNWTPF